jgi:hypothetical protein
LDLRAAVLRRAPPGAVRPNLLPNEQIQKFDKLLTMLDEKQFSLIEAEVAHIQDDTGLMTATRERYRKLSAGYQMMKDLYAQPVRPAPLYATRVRELRAAYLREVEALQKELKVEVPPPLLALLKQSVNGVQPPVGIEGTVPAPSRSRDVPRPRSQPRGAPDPGATPGQAAGDRMRRGESAVPAFESGVERFHRGEYRQAYAVFRNSLQSQADDARVWYYAALSYGLASGDWGRDTQVMAEEGVAREKAGKPPKSEIDEAFAGLTRETGKDWLDFYRRRAQ